MGDAQSDDFRLSTFDLRPSTFDFRLSTFDLRPSTFDLRPSTFDLRLSTFDLRLSTFDFRPSTFRPSTSDRRAIRSRPPAGFGDGVENGKEGGGVQAAPDFKIRLRA
jgi:hypothetical protein